MNDRGWLVYSDLDATLLDAATYSFEAARPALRALSERSIPLVLCTSKTGAETLHWQARLGIAGPFVCEDGGGVGVPAGYFAQLPEPREDRGTHVLLPLAARRSEIRQGLASLRRFAGDALRSFEDMSVDELARETGLPLDLARLAKVREFDEPFRILRDEEEFAPALARLAAEHGLRVTRGGRYYHLHGDTDKGRAVGLLTGLFLAKLGPVRTVGLGDSPLDLPLLKAVDVPVAVRKPDGRHDPELVAGVPNLRAEDGVGPAGWNRAVLEEIGR